jgi:hypothetical protein
MNYQLATFQVDRLALSIRLSHIVTVQICHPPLHKMTNSRMHMAIGNESDSCPIIFFVIKSPGPMDRIFKKRVKTKERTLQQRCLRFKFPTPHTRLNSELLFIFF